MQEISTLFPFNGKLMESLNPFPLPDLWAFWGGGGRGRKEWGLQDPDKPVDPTLHN